MGRRYNSNTRLGKGALPILIAKLIMPSDEYAWVHVLVGVSAVLGHNHSIFLRESITDPKTGRKKTIFEVEPVE
ncbi:MAG: hypothetical protein CM1200mP6_00530 [Anaerolineaceae bacterium]|nr:MAG: hypothetical protein CM1200mP6_00530 [Anaerolineaceae bacterium]